MKNKEKEILNALVADEKVEVETVETVEIQKPRRRRAGFLFSLGQYHDPSVGIRTPFTFRF